MDRNLQPQVESDCSQKVKNVGQLVIGGSAFALLGAVGQFNMPRIGEMGHFMHDMVPVLLCMGAWGVATGIGLLRGLHWARISLLVLSSLLAVYRMLGVVIFLLIPSGGKSGWALLLLKTGTVALHLISIAIGVL